MSNSTKIKFGISEFNTKKLPTEKFGKCEFEHHHCNTVYPNLKCNTRLMMLYSDIYAREGDGCGELDIEKYNTMKWEPDSEFYCCEPCVEELSDG